MTRESITKRIKRILRLALYMHQHGGTAHDLARFSQSTEGVFRRDLAMIRIAGIDVECKKGFYSIKSFPDLMKIDDEDDPRQEHFRNTIFRKWYKVIEKDGNWYVARADKKDPRGTLVGPVRIAGKSWYPRAIALAQKRNQEIRHKRQVVIQKMLSIGWEHDQIKQFQGKALEEARKELGNPNYVEENP